MNRARLVISIIAVFIAQAAVNGAIFGLFMSRLALDASLMRPESEKHVGVYMLSRVLFISLFVFVYAGWYPSRGLGAGLRFGLLVWLFYSVPMTVGFWSFMRMSDALAGCWVGIGLIENLVAGLVVGLIYNAPNQPPRRPLAPVGAGAGSSSL